MLTLLKIKNIALIESLEVEFGAGLNLLTGETGSGKSIIVDSLGALTGERVSAELIKDGEQSATIEGLFSLAKTGELPRIFDESGVEMDGSELIVRRELSASGRNRVFVNNQLATQAFLKRIGPYLVDIHGQGDQASLFDPAAHMEMLDTFAGAEPERFLTAEAYLQMAATRKELANLRHDESDKLQLLDILKFQVDEIRRADLKPGEDTGLGDEKRRLNNVEKLSTLSDDAYMLLYEQDDATIATFDKAARKIDELAQYDSRFAGYREPLETARAVLEDVAATARDFRNHIEFSPNRLEEIENRLAEIARVSRKYGGTVEAALAHLAESEQRLENIETAEFREHELEKKLEAERRVYLEAATRLRNKRVGAASKFEKEVEANLKTVALEKARFEVRIDSPHSLRSGNNSDSPPSEGGVAAASADGVVLFSATNSDLQQTKRENHPAEAAPNSPPGLRRGADASPAGWSRKEESLRSADDVGNDNHLSARGIDRVEFFFSANPGESPKPLAKVASGGEASRLMLILKTSAKTHGGEKSAVFDEIDAGIGGRVAEAVGVKLKQLARSQQVLCVTHQPQVASLADRHFAVEKSLGRNKTIIEIRELTDAERVEEIARMLAGEKITDSARTHAAEMIESAKKFTAETRRRREKGKIASG